MSHWQQPARDDVARAEVEGGRVLTAQVRAVGKIEPSPTDGVSTACSTASSAGTTRTVRRPSPASPSSCGRRSDRRARPRRPRHDHRHRVAHRPGRARRPRHRRERRAPRGRGGGRALAVAAALRLGLADVSSGPPRRGRLIAGLAVGDTSASRELDAAMKASSLSHLTAVSGANCALIVAGAFGLAALCRARRGVRVGAGLVALGSFVILVRRNRASCAPRRWRDRDARHRARSPWRGLALATAIAVLLVSDPWLGLSLGFALSSARPARSWSEPAPSPTACRGGCRSRSPSRSRYRSQLRSPAVLSSS
jgi:competence protein ComEC